MGFIVETPPKLRHKCKLPPECYLDENNVVQPSYAHLTIWQCDECKEYYMYEQSGSLYAPLGNKWKLISEKKALKLKNKWVK